MKFKLGIFKTITINHTDIIEEGFNEYRIYDKGIKFQPKYTITKKEWNKIKGSFSIISNDISGNHIYKLIIDKEGK